MTMTTRSIQERFEEHDDGDEYGQFKRIEHPLHRRADISAFLLLDSLCPPLDNGSDIIAAAENDVIYLDVDLDTLGDNITDAQILDLVRCGVVYDSENGGLMMFE